jgi:hypothetical protein
LFSVSVAVCQTDVATITETDTLAQFVAFFGSNNQSIEHTVEKSNHTSNRCAIDGSNWHAFECTDFDADVETHGNSFASPLTIT